MPLQSLPALFMRGGTSNGLVFDVRDLPADRAAWDAIFLAAMGSPDPNGRQLDGMGGGVSSLSKVCVIAPSSRDDADIDYTFAQVSVGAASVDYAGNCGNMAAAMAPAALRLGLIRAEGAEARVRIHNTNTARIIVATFPLEDGQLAPDGDLAIDGVAGAAAPIRLDFLDPGGAKTGKLLPTGRTRDRLALPDGSEVEASLVDAANPCVFVAASDLGKSGTEHPDDLQADPAFLERIEAIRQAGSVRMGLTPDLASAAKLASIPKVAIVAPPAEAKLLSGRVLAPEDMHLLVRMMSMGQAHRAVPITGAICLGLACRLAGSIPASCARPDDAALTLAHPSGTVLVDAETTPAPEGKRAISGAVYRTARLLFSGTVFFPAPISG
ncbi:MAG: 2-methylaconitate cis-trans isomerase PrpF family protein [Albimonas sp.]|uniref:PrpF domain-containing protein n=1 Tax=Albimonas sp. TaxID=1872425 RepID=UPI0040564052|tara:strand:+ start:2742 stop:3890 length:1149 start_codon:yes stop_codon:yes gene_type:complete